MVTGSHAEKNRERARTSMNGKSRRGKSGHPCLYTVFGKVMGVFAFAWKKCGCLGFVMVLVGFSHPLAFRKKLSCKKSKPHPVLVGLT